MFILGLTAVVSLPGVAFGHKVQVADPEARARVAQNGGRLLADYGSYQLYEVPSVDPSVLTRRGTEARDDYDFIHLNAQSLDTSKAEIKALRKPLAAFRGKQMHLVQFTGPVLPSWYEALVKTGVKIVDYIPQNAYLVHGDSPSLTRLQQLTASTDYIQWDGPYADDDKFHPKARPFDEKGNPRNLDTDAFTIQLVADGESNPSTLQLIDSLRLAPIQRQYNFLHFVNITVRLAPASLQKIAAQPDVVSIHPYYEPQKFCEHQDQIVAGNLTGNVPTGPGYLAWLTSKGFTQAQFDASGFVVDVSDSGIDNGTTSPNHFGLYKNGTRPGTSRVAYARLEGTPNSGSTIQGCDGHGNLNSHIISGYDDLTGFPFADASGFHYGLGVCPFVKVGSSVIFEPSNFTSPTYQDLMSRAYRDGSRVSNNSWGSSGTSSRGTYDSDTQAYDALVRDAQPSGSAVPATGNQEMVIVFAAGNDGSGAGTVQPPGTGKNIISVGAGENVQAFGGSDGSGISDSGADSANDIISFSSRGPCDDGRFKPDLCAPGTHVSGGVAQTSNPGTLGTANTCFDGSGVSGGVGSIYFPSGQQFYTASSGTSHSTPGVVGGCALIRQYFINNFGGPPSPAMTKAYLLNSTRYMTGTGAGGTLPSNSQGMGGMNLGMAFDGVALFMRDEVGADLFTASGQARTFTGTVADPTKPFRVTVAWTDAPGSTTGNAYNNNLDLSVTIGGNTYKGNVFSGQYSTTGGSADTKNNVECVFLPAGVSGAYTVTVTAASINSDGVPGNAFALDQDFALVVYNGTQVLAPSLAANGSTLTAESCSPANGFVDPGETVTVSLAVTNVGTAGTVNLMGTLLATNGVTSPGSAQTYGAVANGGSVSQPFTFTATGTCGGNVIATLQLQDGSTNYGNVTYTIPLGQIVTDLSQNFDGVSAPALPTGWATSASGGQSNWVTSTASFDSSPNAAFSADNSVNGVNELDSPSIAIASANAQLSFRQNYSLTASSTNPAIGYDGGVVEIKIGAGSYTDILAAGGTFTSGGYNTALSSGYSNPLAGRQAWSGNSSGFITTVVNLPASAAGQNVQLRWRCGAGSPPPQPAALTSSGTLAYWSFDASTATPDTVASGLAVTAVTIGNVGGSLTYFNGNPNTGKAIATSGFTTSAGPPDTTYSYFAFAVTVSNGFQAALSSLSLDPQRSTQGPVNFSVQASQNAGFSPLIYDSGVKTATTSFATTTLTLTNSGLTGTIYFRIYAYKAGGTGTLRIDNLNVQGSVGSAGPGGWYIDTVSVSDPTCCSGTTPAPVALFTGSPTNGTAPLNVSFTDSSTGTPTGWAWDFGDGGNSTAQNPSHTYAAGTWTVTLIASNAGGSTTNTKANYITVLTPFQSWQNHYWAGGASDPNAAPDLDPYGKGFSNTNQFLAGFNPTNTAAYPQIINIVTTNGDVNVTYLGANGDNSYSGGPASRTNLLEYAAGASDGSYSNNFVSTGATNILSNGNGSGIVTNMTDVGGATNGPSRYYRVRILVP